MPRPLMTVGWMVSFTLVRSSVVTRRLNQRFLNWWNNSKLWSVVVSWCCCLLDRKRRPRHQWQVVISLQHRLHGGQGLVG